MADLHLNLKFFQNKKGVRFLPEYLDDQLNAVVNYVNLDLIPYIEQINFNVTSGVVGDVSSVFCNIADNDTGYMYLNDVNFDDNLLSLSKLIISPKGSVLGSSTIGNIIAITPVESNCLLFADLVNNITFRKIISDDLDNNVITGNKLQALNADNFAVGSFIDIIPDGSITQNNLQNVSNAKISDGSIDFRNLGVFPNSVAILAIATQLNLDDFEDNCFTPEKILNATINWTNFIENKPITKEKLQPMHITDSYLLPYVANTARPVNRTLDGYKASNFSAIINLDGIFVQNVRLTKPKIALGCVSKTHFDQELQTAIARYIQIKNNELNPPVQKTAGQLGYEYISKIWRENRSIKLFYNDLDHNVNIFSTEITYNSVAANFNVLVNIRYSGYDVYDFDKIIVFKYLDVHFRDKRVGFHVDLYDEFYTRTRILIKVKSTLTYEPIANKDFWIINVTMAAA